MRILFVDSQYPMPDRASADVRMFAIVSLLREQGHDCRYYVSDIGSAESRIDTEEFAHYRYALESLGVCVKENCGFEQTVSDESIDMLFFNYFHPADAHTPLVQQEAGLRLGKACLGVLKAEILIRRISVTQPHPPLS